MITGDAEDTAVAVASAVGFFDPTHHRTLSGAEIEQMAQSELEVRQAHSSTSPAAKSRVHGCMKRQCLML